MSGGDLAFNYADLYYVELIGDGNKNPAKAWGGYSQDYDEAEAVYRHADVEMVPGAEWGVVGIDDIDHGALSLLIFDLDIYKAGPAFDPAKLKFPSDVPVVESPSGGFHVYFAVHRGRGEGAESDFRMTRDFEWDIDIRGSFVSHHVVAPADIPGVNGEYELVQDGRIKTVFDPGDAADMIQYDGEPLLEYNPDTGAVGADGFEFDRPSEPPEDMPTCYHAGLELRKANPDDHPNTHKVNVLTALCGLGAGYDPATVVDHFVGEYAPGGNADRDKTEYQVKHLARNLENGRYSPPAVATLRDYGILDDGEGCDCSIDYHGGDGGDIPSRSPREIAEDLDDGEEMPFWVVRELAVELDVLPRDAFITRETDDGDEYLGFPGAKTYNNALDAIEEAGFEHNRERVNPAMINRPGVSVDERENGIKIQKESDDGYAGPLVENERGYAKRIPDGDGGTTLVQLTNFHLDVLARLNYPDEGTREFQLEVQPTSESDPSYTVEADPVAFNELRTFKNTVLKGFSTRFDGSQEDLNELREFVAAQDAPTRTGTKDLGLHDGDAVVTPHGVIGPDGWVDDPEYVYTGDDMAVNKNWTLTPDTASDVDAEAVRTALENLPRHRDPERLLPVLGWFYTAPLSPYVRDWEGEFNVLNITGDTGAGKSSSIELFWKLFGIGEEGVKVDGTTFPLMRNMSSGDLPVFFDEYKPSDMADYKVNSFHNYLRTATRGGSEQRGNADKTVESYHLRTPAAVVGEQPIQGPAEERRTILTSFKRDARDSDEYARAFYRLDGGSIGGELYEGTNPAHHALAYYKWVASLDEDTLREWWTDARDFVLGVLDRLELENLDDIVVQGYVTVTFGVRLFRRFATVYSADVANVADGDIERSLEYLTTEGSGAEHRSHLERFLNVMGRAIADGALEHDEHYTFVHKGKPSELLCVKMQTAFDKVRRYAREHDVAGEDLFSNLRDYDSRIRDAAEKDGTAVVETSKYTRELGRTVAFDPNAILVTKSSDDEEAAEEAAEERESDTAETRVADLEPTPAATVRATVASVLEPKPFLQAEGVLRDETGVIDYVARGQTNPAADVEQGEVYVFKNVKVCTDGDGVLQIELRDGVTEIEPVMASAGQSSIEGAATDGGVAAETDESTTEELDSDRSDPRGETDETTDAEARIRRYAENHPGADVMDVLANVDVDLDPSDARELVERAVRERGPTAEAVDDAILTAVDELGDDDGRAKQSDVLAAVREGVSPEPAADTVTHRIQKMADDGRLMRPTAATLERTS